MAARHESTRFRKMNGYGSNGFQIINALFVTTHKKYSAEYANKAPAPTKIGKLVCPPFP